MSDQSRLNVLIEDYRLIRAEAVYRLGARQAITGLFIPIIGSLVAAAYKADDLTKALVLGLAVPFVCYETIYLWLAETQALRRASKYLHGVASHIKQEIVLLQSGRTEPPVLGWEQQLRESMPEADRGRYYRRHFIYNTLLFWIPAVVFSAIGSWLTWRESVRLGTVMFAAETTSVVIALCAFKHKADEIIALYSSSAARNPDTV